MTGVAVGSAVASAVDVVAGGATLPVNLATAAMDELMDGGASPVQVAALLAMLRVRGETADELAAFARVMRARAVRVAAPADAVDLCGTGADGVGTFNVSTPSPHGRARPTSSRRSASRSTPGRRRWLDRSARPASASCSRRPTIRR